MTYTPYLFWLDLEMTGLDFDHDTILEISSLITDDCLTIVHRGPTIQVYQPPEVVRCMDSWNTEQHTKSGLLDLVAQSALTVADAEKQTLKFLAAHCAPQQVPLCGNSVYQDRFFMRRLMPQLEAYVHYRVVDVSSVKELVHRWYPTSPHKEFVKQKLHRAEPDVYESIDELRWYRTYFFV